MIYQYLLVPVLDGKLSGAMAMNWYNRITAHDHKSYFKVIQHQETV